VARLSLTQEFGQLVRDWRKERGFSQEQFALHAGINRSYMTHIERGKKLPSIAVVARIARGLGVEVSAIWLELERRGATVDAVTDEPRLV
jgi:transcriptional regulator with XRE-family HTH domain